MEYLSLKNLGFGAAEELFNDSLVKVLENISDPNTDYKKVRKINLEVLIKPNESRGKAEVGIFVKSTLAPVKPYTTDIYIGKDRGKYVATEQNVEQMDLFNNNESKLEVLAGGK